ncbi:MAG: transposase [Acidobacteriaceae bacterium]
MMIIGVDYHPSFQTIAFLMEETGECGEQELKHSDGQAEKFYRDLKQRGICVRVGMEATGYSRWFERLLAELGFELWIGDPAEIKAKRIKKQKTDRNDARLLRRLMLENNFPQNLATEPGESRSATTVVAPASVGADAHADHESTAGIGHERRLSLEEKAVQRTGTSTVGEAHVGSLGQSAPARVVGVAGPYESDH